MGVGTLSVASASDIMPFVVVLPGAGTGTGAGDNVDAPPNVAPVVQYYHSNSDNDDAESSASSSSDHGYDKRRSTPGNMGY
jgi:hypothetical protein